MSQVNHQWYCPPAVGALRCHQYSSSKCRLGVCVLHRSHLSHRRRGDQRENPRCNIDISQALCLGQLSNWQLCTLRLTYSPTAVELANARCATTLLVWVEFPITGKAFT